MPVVVQESGREGAMNYTKKSFSTSMPGAAFADRWEQTFGKEGDQPCAERVARVFRKTHLEPYWECATCSARCPSIETLLEHRKLAH
jgi:hypothetical protein